MKNYDYESNYQISPHAQAAFKIAATSDAFT